MNLGDCSNNTSIEEYVSIIIPFRNESANILNSLKSIEELNYPKEKFEVIYVNDSSDDDSFIKLSKAIKSSNIKAVSASSQMFMGAHKKRAVNYGITQSKGEIIVTTDADCMHSPDWLTSLLGCFDEKTGFVSGPVEFFSNGSLFNKLQKLEFAGLIIAGAGLIGINRPVICNAANIAYRKRAFFETGGFGHNFKLSSGDDELLMQNIWKQGKYKVKFCSDKEAIVKTLPSGNLQQFIQQRKRWASKGLFYNDHLLVLQLILIFLFYLSLVAIPILFIAASVNLLYLFVTGLLLKLLLEYIILNKGRKFLFTDLDLSLFFLAEIIHIPYIIFAGAAGIFGNFTWKARKVRR